MNQIFAFLTIITCILLSPTIEAQELNTAYRSNFHDPSLVFSGVRYNDVWGYAAPDGREYAIMGSRSFTHFVDVTDPDNIVEVQRIAAGGSCLWRDYKTFGHYAYGVSEFCNGGIEIFDLSSLPTSVAKVYDSTEFITNTHNVFIDTLKGKLYLTGLSDVSADIKVLDLNADPEAPTFIADLDLPFGYVHDLHVRNDTAYCSHGNASRVVIYDFSDPVAGAEMIGSFQSNGYNHSSWTTEDHNYLVIADETSDEPVLIADISDKETPTFASSFQSTLLGANNSLAHNPFVIGNDFAILSYYDDGLQIYKIDSASSPFLAGYYDTDTLGTFYSGDGAWGAYPFLPSGNLLASDITFGLFVITPQFPLRDCTSNVSVEGTYDNHWDLISKDNMTSQATYADGSRLIMRAPDEQILSPGFTIGSNSTFDLLMENACGMTAQKRPSKKRRK